MTGELMPKGARFRPFAKAVLRTQSDERLVRLVREGSDTAFEEIVRRYRQPLVAFAAAYGPADPEDVVQESLTRAWESLRRSTEAMNLKPWLYTIVRNRALNAKRDARVHEELTDQIDGVRQPADIVLANDELARVVTAVAALPEHQRQALVRSALEGHTHEQIADAIGATPGAVRQLIFRGRTAVRHGVGLLIPLPLVRMLAESGTAAEVGAGGAAAASGGAALTGGATSAGAGAGASLAAKAAIVAVVGTVAAGSGVAIHRSHEGDRAREPAARETISEISSGNSSSGGLAVTPASEVSDSGPGSGELEIGDRGGHDGDGSNGGGPEPGDDSGSAGPAGSAGPGPSPSSGSGSDDEDLGAEASGTEDGHSGSDGSRESGSSGSSGSGSSGSGSSGSGSSGSGSSSHGSGSTGSDDSSGSSESSGSSDSSESSDSGESGDRSGSGDSGSGSSDDDPASSGSADSLD